MSDCRKLPWCGYCGSRPCVGDHCPQWDDGTDHEPLDDEDHQRRRDLDEAAWCLICDRPTWNDDAVCDQCAWEDARFEGR